MDLINKQESLLSGLANIMNNNAEVGYDSVTMILTARPENSKASAMKLYFEFTIGGETKNIHLTEANDNDADDAAYDLHELMRQQSGRAWSQITLTLSGDGRLTTEFVYPDEE